MSDKSPGQPNSAEDQAHRARVEAINGLFAMLPARRLAEAVAEADRLLAQAPPPPPSGGPQAYSFSNLQEFVFYLCKYHVAENKREVVWSSDYSSDILLAKASALYELQRHREAVEVLRQAIARNPVGTSYRFELAENLIMLKDCEQAARELRALVEFLLYPEEIARFYRRMGYLYTEFKDYDLAEACHLYSLQLEDSDKAMQEVTYIEVQCRGNTDREAFTRRLAQFSPKVVVQMLRKAGVLVLLNDERADFLANVPDERNFKATELYRSLGIMRATAKG